MQLWRLKFIKQDISNILLTAKALTSLESAKKLIITKFTIKSCINN